ncbi:LAMI_0H16336g1_1 [Lachancea mirantina]|uniref:RNA exonuclease 3 n=1 Tax=Lachancea mirantina TaxID=1230905 RepID=A0A1G4KJB6_9SACH|nr:LAMI_0H16336g1_1 [Lachancea mirantina]
MAVVRPVDLKEQPAPYQHRFKVLQKILESLEKNESKTKPAGVNLAERATQLEREIAQKSTSSQSYRFNASLLLRDIVKGKIQQGESIEGSKKRKLGQSFELTRNQVMEMLSAILIDEKTLLQNGYFLPDSRLEDEDHEFSGNRGVAFTDCVRCSTRFKKDDILSPTTCRYHLHRKRYNRDTKESVFPCCGETTSSSSLLALGCKTHQHHVFRAETLGELAKISEFKSTAQIEGNCNVLALDCEMAYTSAGYELIRLTVVDFFTSEVLYDEIVKPFGTVIDLNSEFSGVHSIDDETASSFEQMLTKVLNKTLINRNSILVGHGLENDLNVMRILHRKIIDTAILYPRGRFKSSLKNLAFEIISRRIQVGEHDSSEDAIATMDVIKAKLGIPLAQKTWK